MSRKKGKTERRQTGNNRNGKSEYLKKGDATRERILTAARRVFARHQYNAASLRMVASEGNFEHGIIRYHFPSKAELFKTIMSGICEDFYHANVSWLEEVKTMPPREGLALYVEHVMAYNAKKPEAMRILIQNIALMDDPESVPGYEYMTEFLVDTRQTFEEKLSLQVSGETVRRFIDSFNGLLLYYLGASPCQAQILGMKPTGRKYRNWVKETMVSVFLPLLEQFTTVPGRRGR